MASFKEMQKTGVIKRADKSRILYSEIHIEPGFNAEGRHDPEDPENISLLAHIKAGGKLPALEVRPRAEGGVWVVEGHRRYVETGNAVAQGCDLLFDKDGELRMDVEQFEGNDVDRHARVVTSQSNMKLTPLQLGLRYKTIRGFNKTPDEIARIVHKTRQHVDQMLILADANHDVQQAVKAGDISATEAVKLQRQHGEEAGAVIKEAKEKTGGKVTAKAIKPWTPPAKVLSPVLDGAKEFNRLLTPNQLQAILKNEDADIRFNAKVFYPLLAALEQMEAARQAAEQKARDKVAKGTQKVWPFGNGNGDAPPAADGA